ncbi:MAG TPA: competence protein ComEA [Dehalococcoidia bacterium]|nr:competence protein ComEA [Dehalococcoidia bacterium]HAS27873.1 competence protein ComEA [Dehalococcoidia bacterium]
MLKRTPLIFIVAIILIIFNLFSFTGCGNRPEILITPADTPGDSATEYVYVGGSVNNPGFYPLKSTDSIKSLLNAAGGIESDLTEHQIELTINNLNNTSQKININRAEAWLLQALPGIGETRANAIIQYRTDNDGFKNTNELLKVKGIGENTFDNIKSLITVDD